MPWTFSFTYPGVSRAYSFRYLTSIGISPGTFEVTVPAGDSPALGGTVQFGVTDGTTTRLWVHPGCKLLTTDYTFSGSDRALKLIIQDRRWAWLDRLQVSGHFNQQDDHRKLIPKSIRSPFQLAVILLTAMGEPVPSGGWHTAIDLPGGLALPASVPLGIPAQHPTLDVLANPADDFLRSGTNFSRSQANPITVWDATPAAVALAELCDTYGRTVVLSPRDNRVRIYKLGSGTTPPAGRLLSDTPALNIDTVPTHVIARGSPTKYQVRLRFRAVGRDWDGAWKPLNRLCYTPEQTEAGRPMVCKVKVVAATYLNTRTYSLVLNRVRFAAPPGTHTSAAGVVTYIRGLINASTDPRVAGKVTMAGDTLTGSTNGDDFRLRGIPGDQWEVDCTEGPLFDAEPQYEEWYSQIYETVFGAFSPADTVTVTISGGYSFTSTAGVTLDAALAQIAEHIRANSTAAIASATGNTLLFSARATGSPLTITVNTTAVNTTIRIEKSRDSAAKEYSFRIAGNNSIPRPNPFLNYRESVSAIRDGVYRYYQLLCEDAANPDKKTITVPLLGEVDSRHLLMLLGERVEQTAPRPGDTLAIDMRNNGQPFAEDTYTGYSSNRKPAVYASIVSACWGGVNYRAPGGIGSNTAESQQIYIPFEIVDPLRQVIRFAQPIYNVYGHGDKSVYLSAEPVVEMAVHVIDKVTLDAKRYSYTYPVPGGFSTPVTRTFDDIQAERVAQYDEDHNYIGFYKIDADPEFRAQQCAEDMASRYQMVGSRTLVYNNLEDLDLDGLVRQVQFSTDASGFDSQCSINSEFSRRILPYGERRRQENLPPDAQRAAENMAWGRQSAGGHAVANATDRVKRGPG